MNDELTATKTHMWELVPLLAGENIICCKWVYEMKTHSDGCLEQYKACLVFKGFSHE